MAKRKKLKQKPITQSDFARRQGVSPQAIGQAIRDGRLAESIVLVDGVAMISDAALAAAELAARTRPRADRPADAPNDSGDYRAARARREAAEASIAEIELGKLAGTLVLAHDIEARLVGVFSSCRTKLLAVGSQARQRDPSFTVEQIELIESLLREALEDLAGPAAPQAAKP